MPVLFITYAVNWVRCSHTKHSDKYTTNENHRLSIETDLRSINLSIFVKYVVVRKSKHPVVFQHGLYMRVDGIDCFIILCYISERKNYHQKPVKVG